MPKWLGGAIVLLVVLYVISQPTHAADLTNNAWGWASSAGHHLSSFVNHLGS